MLVAPIERRHDARGADRTPPRREYRRSSNDHKQGRDRKAYAQCSDRLDRRSNSGDPKRRDMARRSIPLLKSIGPRRRHSDECLFLRIPNFGVSVSGVDLYRSR